MAGLDVFGLALFTTGGGVSGFGGVFYLGGVGTLTGVGGFGGVSGLGGGLHSSS